MTASEAATPMTFANEDQLTGDYDLDVSEEGGDMCIDLAPPEPPVEDRFPMDIWYSWIVLAVSAVCTSISLGSLVSFGVYVVALMDYFNCGKKQAMLVGSAAHGCSAMTGLISAIYYQTLRSRSTLMLGGLISSLGYALCYVSRDLCQLTVSNSIVGFGFGLCTTSLFAVQAEYFSKYKYFAMAFLSVGSAVGQLYWQPVIVVFIKRFGWHGSMLISGGFALQLVVCGMILRTRKTTFTVMRCGQILHLSLFKEFAFILVCVQGTMFASCFNSFLLTINEVMTQNNLTLDQTALLITISGGTNAIGSITAALLNHGQHMNREMLSAGATMMLTLQVYATMFCTSLLSFGFVCGIFGFAFGVIMITVVPLLIDLFGVEKLPTAQGFIAVFFGVGSFVGPIVVGAVEDARGSVEGLHISGACGAVATVCACALTFMQCILKRRAKEAHHQPTQPS